MPYKLNPNKYFQKKYKKLVAKNSQLNNQIFEVFTKLSADPKDISLKSHKVNTPKFGDCISSSINGDLRIIWKYNEELDLEIIDLFDIGGHSGKNSVY